MKKLISTVLAISIILVTFSLTSTVVNASVSDIVTLESLTCDKSEAYVTAKLNFNSVLDCTVIMAVYDGFGKLLNVTYKEAPATIGEFTVNLSGDRSYKNCVSKIFFMDSVNNFRPVNAPIIGIIVLDESADSDYVKIRGVVVETSITDIDAVKEIDTTREPEVVINVLDSYYTGNRKYLENYGTRGEGRFLVGNTNIEDYIGKSVIAYVKLSERSHIKFEIDSFEDDTISNSTLSIPLDWFVTYSNDKIEYYNSDNYSKMSVKTEGNIPLVFNYVGGYTADDLNTLVGADNKFSGEITLIDNDENYEYDIAICKLAATAVVKRPTANAITLYNESYIGGSSSYMRTIYVYPDDETKYVKFYKNGEVIDHTELKEWDVLSVYGSSTRSDVVIAHVTSNKIVGTVSARKASRTSADGMAYKIGDVWYDVSVGFYNDGIYAGVYGEFYIDMFDRIAAFVEIPYYGYLISVNAEKTEFGSATTCRVKVQMLTEDGIEIIEVQNNAIVYMSNGIKNILNIDDWTYTDGVSGDNGKFSAFAKGVGKVVKYTKASDGKIATITAADYENDAGIVDFETAPISGKQEFFAKSIKLGKYIDKNTMAFLVGETSDKYKVVSVADFEDRTIYDVVASYKTKKAGDPNILVITYDSFNTAGPASSTAVVAGISKTIDNGYPVFGVDFLQDGEAKYVFTSADVYESCSRNLTVGDVIKLKIIDDVITNIDFVFDFTEGVRAYDVSNAGAVVTTVGTSGTYETFVGGVVTQYAERGSRVTIGKNEYGLSKGVNFYEIDPVGRELKITVEDNPTFTSISEFIYNGTKQVVTLKDQSDQIVAENISVLDVQRLYSDYVYLRTFEDEVVDVIVVKGYDVKTTENKYKLISGIISGTITSDESAKITAYKIGDVWYSVSETPRNDSVYSLEKGSGGDFYIDQSGKIYAYFEDTTLTDGLKYDYGYVMAITAEEAEVDISGSCAVNVQMLTCDGVKAFNVKNNAKYNKTENITVTLNVDDWLYSSGVTGDNGKFTDFDDIAGTVVKFGTDADGNITSVIEAGYEGEFAVEAYFEPTRIIGNCEFDAEYVSLAKKDIDLDAEVYVVGKTIDQCFVVPVSYLEHCINYDVLASYQTKGAEYPDIIVVTFRSFNGISQSSNVAVVSDVKTSTDEDGFTIYSIEYVQDGEEKYELTTPEIYEAYNITAGDVIKINDNANKGEKISNIQYVFDFDEGVRNYDLNNGSTVSVTVGTPGTDETFVGGAVTNYVERGEEVAIDGTEYRLSKAVNCYTIDNTGRRLVVEKNGGFVSLSEKVYDGLTDSVKIVDSKNQVIQENISVKDVQKLYADYVYLRTFEDDIVDVIIVRGYDVVIE